MKNRPVDSFREESPVLEMPANWTCLIDSGTEDNFESFFSLIEQFSGRKMVPVCAHILQLVGLVLSPQFCLETALPITHPDPLVSSVQKISLRAWNLLNSLLLLAGPDMLLKSLPGPHLKPILNSTLHDDLGTSSRQKKNASEADPIIIKRLATSRDVWDIICDLETSISPPNKNDCLNRVISPGGWDLLELLVNAWELDSQSQQLSKAPLSNNGLSTNTSAQSKSYSLRLLKQFNQAAVGEYRIGTRVLDIIFEPFSTYSTHNYRWGFATNSRSRAQTLAMRVIKLLADLDNHKFLESDRLVKDLTNKMRVIDPPELHVFINILPSSQTLRARLLSGFLEIITRPLPVCTSSIELETQESLPDWPLLQHSNINSHEHRKSASQFQPQRDDSGFQTSTIGESSLSTLSFLIHNLLPRPLLEIPANFLDRNASTARTGDSVQVLLKAESRYLIVLSRLLGLLLEDYKRKQENGLAWYKLVANGRLRKAVESTYKKVDQAYKLFDEGNGDEVKVAQQVRKLERLKIDRIIKGFEKRV
ncbi:hypothetical protein O181_005140 [Austropuccinia psidii MF-1]|uniref:Uncharacterized protein n=1 Tax=Austropuccinia psidii MF-1 TaxID=1389203 RepID=A0A9Q3BHT4_9BASI|nr:hypothetical protein [Austropuccinia psidii MF-1]